MTQPINLNRYRKQKARSAKRAQADENAVKFGRSKAQKTQTSEQNKSDAAKLDGKRLDET